MTRGADTAIIMPAGRRAVRSLLTLGAVVVVIVALGGAALLAFAAVAVDRLQAREEHIRALRILAAEDNPTNTLILRALLEPAGVDLRTVANGREAVEAFRADDFDLILMDVQMPVMNGIEATRAIREREREQRLSPTPILALSANVMSHQILEYQLAGMDGVVAKPIDAEKLIEAIAAAMERGKVGVGVI